MIESQPSSTACLIAAGLLLLNRERPSDLEIPSESVQLGEWLLRNSSTMSRALPHGLNYQCFRSIIRLTESLTIPGILNHYAARKIALERLAREEIARGIRRIQILGAGFDSLGYRLVREFHDLEVREIDHPATQAWKVRGMQACGLLNDRLTFLPCDLSVRGSLDDDDPRALQLWIAEGLLMYFPGSRVDTLFEEFHRHSALGSRFAFTFLESNQGHPDFRRGSRMVNHWLKRRQEPFAWGIKRTELSEFFDSKNMQLVPIDPQISHEMDKLHVGEYLALAKTGS